MRNLSLFPIFGAVALGLSGCSFLQEDPEEYVLENSGDCIPSLSERGSEYATDLKFEEEVVGDFANAVENSPLFQDTWSNFVSRGGKVHSVCGDAMFNPNDRMFMLNAMYTPASLDIHVNANYGYGIYSYLAHELKHHQDEISGHRSYDFFSNGKLHSYDGAVGRELLLEATAQVAGLDFVFERFVDGDKRPLAGLLNLQQIGYSMLPEELLERLTQSGITRGEYLSAPHADVRMAQRYATVMTGWQGDPYSLDFDTIEETELSDSSEVRNRARAAALEEWFGFTANQTGGSNQVTLFDVHNVNYVERVWPHYQQQFTMLSYATNATHNSSLQLIRLADINIDDFTSLGGENYGRYVRDELRDLVYMEKYFSQQQIGISLMTTLALDEHIRTGVTPNQAIDAYVQNSVSDSPSARP